jgi:hypothetical protein
MNKDYPKWYKQALQNKNFFKGEEYSCLLQDGVNNYNKAVADNNKIGIEKWKNFVLKWLGNKETNRLMLMQYKV